MTKILLSSTLSPYPFWAGSEKYWFDLVTDPRTRERFEFHIRLADSPVTREKAAVLRNAGADVSFYRHYNVEFLRRNIARIRDRLTRRNVRTLPWYDEIGRGEWDLVWFNVDGLHNLRELEYATNICVGRGMPYWLFLQHGYEDFYLDDADALNAVTKIATGAKRFVFIAERNRRSLERAIGRTLENATLSRNALSPQEFARANEVSAALADGSDRAEFFNLGRFSPKDKGQILLLEALSDARWNDRDWHLSFIGVAGFGREYLLKMVRYFGIGTERVSTVPFTDDVFSEIAKRDVLLMPSLAEGTPFAMIESMACGRPAVGTPIGGIPELITDGETGWLSRTTDAADIADAMERMWASRGEWRQIGEQARQHVRSYNNEETVFADILDTLGADIAR